jgi:hypothetical protein
LLAEKLELLSELSPWEVKTNKTLQETKAWPILVDDDEPKNDQLYLISLYASTPKHKQLNRLQH